jgi:protein TonB
MNTLLALSASLAFLAAAVGPVVDPQRSHLRDNYPASAVQRHEEGAVGVTVTVGTDGRARDCVVSRSSGFADLDRAACQQVVEFAHYKSARDDAGHPVEANFSTTITYKSR